MGVCLRSSRLAPGRRFTKAKTQAEAKENSCVTPCAMQFFFDENTFQSTKAHTKSQTTLEACMRSHLDDEMCIHMRMLVTVVAPFTAVEWTVG